MFARRPKIDTTFGVPMDLNRNGIPASRKDNSAAKNFKQSPLIEDGGNWLSRMFDAREQVTPPLQPKSKAKPKQAEPASWGARETAHVPRASAASHNAYAAFVSALETLRLKADGVEIGAKTILNAARVIFAISLYLSFIEGGMDGLPIIVGAWTIAGLVAAERLGLLNATRLHADKLPGLSGRSIAFTTGTMLGFGLGALAGGNQVPLPAFNGLIGLFVSAFAYAVVGGKLGEWVATKAERHDLLGRPAP